MMLSLTAHRDPASATTKRVIGELAPALMLTGAILLARLIYLAWLCPYDLVEDEAFYWDWSRNLAWSYNTKGPGIAWALWLSTHLLGDTMLGVRSVAIVSAAVFSISVAALGAMLARAARLDDRSIRISALVASAIVALMPGFQVTSILSTIDGPYVACWSVACAAGAWAMIERRRHAWPVLGAALAIGFLFKYTILLLPVGLAIFALRQRARSRRAVITQCTDDKQDSASAPALTPTATNVPAHAPWIALGIFIFALGLAPVLIWNAQHDWSTIRHLLGHLGIHMDTGVAAPPLIAAGANASSSEAWSVRYFAEFAGAQLAILGPIGVLMVVAAASFRHASSTRPLASLLTWAALPIVVFYFAIALIQEAEGNWAIAGYVSLIPLAAVYVTIHATRLTHTQHARPARWPFAAWHATIILGVITGLGSLKLDWVQSSLALVSPSAARAVPLGRLTGAQTMARAIDERLDELRTRTGLEPFVMVEHYGRASQMAFYLRGQPRVVCASSFVGGRRVQQDFWPDHRPDWPALRDRPAVVVDSFNRAELWRTCFARVEPLGELPGGSRGTRFAFLCEGFKGLTPPAHVGY